MSTPNADPPPPPACPSPLTPEAKDREAQIPTEQTLDPIAAAGRPAGARDETHTPADIDDHLAHQEHPGATIRRSAASDAARATLLVPLSRQREVTALGGPQDDSSVGAPTAPSTPAHLEETAASTPPEPTIDPASSGSGGPAATPAAAAGRAGMGGGTAEVGGAVLGPDASFRASLRKDGRVASDADFQIVRKIGAGGMGTVYVARQSTLAREVALKMVKPEYSGNEGTEALFLSEALVTGDLEHPNIIPVYDLGRTSLGQPFMAMKLVRGIAWSTLIHPEDGDKASAARGAAMTLREHINILIKVCDAVAYAHSRGIIHRDLKPTNVMVGAFGEVLVMDWGICVDVHENPGKLYKTAPRSQTSGISGTPHYMPPELARGETQSIGTTTDVYLLGGILYEILTLTPPHQGSNVRDVVVDAADNPVQLPESRAPDRPIPRELGRIAMHALARDPTDRYADALAFRDALHAYLAHEESLRLSESASALLCDLSRPGAVAHEDRYGVYARVLSRLGEALHLWPANEDAQIAQAKAAAGFADDALARGDAGLAAAQIPILMGNPRVDGPRLDALRAALRTHRYGRLRSLLAACVVTLLVLVVHRFLSNQQAQVLAAQQIDEALAHRQTTLTLAWNAVRDADVPRLGSLIHDLEASAAQQTPLERMHIRSLALARGVLLWQRQRWQELLECVGLEWEASGTTATALSRILSRREVTGTPLAARLAPLAATGHPPASQIWSDIGQGACAGDRVATLEAAIEELTREGTRPPDLTPSTHGLWPALARSAVMSLVLAHTPAGQDPDAITRASGEVIPFLLDDGPIRAGTSPVEANAGIILEPGPMGSFVAWDRSGIAPRWRLRSIVQSARTVVPATDGTARIAADGQILRVEVSSGRVLSRAYVDGSPMLAWPDPTDRSHLVVAVMQRKAYPFGGLQPVVFGSEEFVTFKGDAPVARHLAGSGHPATMLPDQNELMVALAPYMAVRTTLDAMVRIERRRKSAGAKILLSREATPLVTLVPAAFLDALDQDPTNPDLAAFALQKAGLPAPAAWRQLMADRVVRAPGLFPIHAVALGGLLDQAGFPREADRLYAQAAGRFLDLGGNAALSVMVSGSPVVVLRWAGGILFGQGSIDRALELIEVGRQFSTFIEGDHPFYLRYLAWLRSKHRIADAERIAPRVRASTQAGGARLFAAAFYLLTDVALFMHFLACLVLFLVVCRQWERARRTIAADLFAHGMRTTRDVILGLFTQPIAWVSYSALAYSTRPQRALVAALGVTTLASASIFVANQTASREAGIVAAPLGTGILARGDALAFLEKELAQRGPRTGALHLLAEARHERDEDTQARAALDQCLRISPDDAQALSNRAFLEEQEGQRERARADDLCASKLGGDAAAVARWNLARLDHDDAQRQAAFALLAPQDRLNARHQDPGAALWALSPFADLLDTVLDFRGIARRTWEAFLQIANGRTEVASALMLGTDDSMVPGLFVVMIDLTLILTVLALVWLPFRVRPLLKEPAPAASGATSPAHPGPGLAADPSCDGFARARTRAVAALDLVLPGLGDLLWGDATLGSIRTLLLGLGWFTVLASVLGGIAGQEALDALPMKAGTEYFPGIPQMRGYLQATTTIRAAVVLLVTLYAAPMIAGLVRRRREARIRRQSSRPSPPSRSRALP